MVCDRAGFLDYNSTRYDVDLSGEQAAIRLRVRPRQKTANHPAGDYVRDEDGDGFHEVHVNTLEGFWSLLRSWLRPHRGISQEKLPLYLGFFEFVHNARRRGKALLDALLAVLVAP